MLLVGIQVYHYIVKVCYYKLIHILMKCKIDIGLEGHGSIHQFKRCDAILEVTVSTSKRSFSLIAGTNMQCMVGGYDIQLCIPFFLLRRSKKIHTSGKECLFFFVMAFRLL